MFMRASKKLGLDHAVLTNLERGRGRGGGRRKRGEEEVDRAAIDKILKLGAYGLFDEEGDQRAQEFVDRDIDEILEKHSHVITFGGSDGAAAADGSGAGTEGGEKKEGEASSAADVDGGTSERKEGAVGGDGDTDEKDRASSSTSGGHVTQANAAASQFRLNYNKMRFTSEKESSGLDVNDTLFWEKLMGNSAVSLVIPPDELLAQLTDQSAIESTDTRAVFVSRLERTAVSILDAKKRGEEADVDALVNLLIQFSAASAFSDSEREKASEWLLEAEKRVERRARLRVREDDSADKRRSSKRRGFPEELRRSSRSRRRGDEAAEAEGDEALLAGEDSDFSLGDSDAFDDEERTKGGRVRGRAGALMNVDVCDVCWTSGSLLGCDGPCERWFHLSCLGMDEPPDESAVWLCADCDEKHHTCRICGQRDVDDWKGDQGVRCCSVPKCGLFYHLACVRDNPLTVFYSQNNNSSFKCPAHYCYKCAAIGEVYYVHCLCCERAEHVKCMGSSEVRLAKKIIFCEFCVDRERQSERGQAAINGSIVHTQLPPVREKRKLKRPRKSGSSRRKEGGRTGERRMSRQQWERMTEEEKEAELARRAERRQEQKARARVKQREKRAAKRAARLGLTPEAAAQGGDESDSSSSSSGSSSSGSSHSSSSSSASDSDSSSSSSSSASSSSASSSASSSSSSSSSSSDTDSHPPSTYFRPGSYIVRFLLDGEKQYETSKQAMFHPTGKRRRKKSKRLDPHKEERRRKKEKRRREREKKDRARRARHDRRKRKREEEEKDKARKEEKAKRGKEEKVVGGDEKERLKEEKEDEREQKEPTDVHMQTKTEPSAVKDEGADDGTAAKTEEHKGEHVWVKDEPEDVKDGKKEARATRAKKRRSSPAADTPSASAAKVKHEEKDEASSDDKGEEKGSPVSQSPSPTKSIEDRDARISRRSSRSLASALKEDKPTNKSKQQQQETPAKVVLPEPEAQQRRRSTRSPLTVQQEKVEETQEEAAESSSVEDRKVRVSVRVRDKRHDALVGRGVVGALRSKRLARIKEEDREDEAEGVESRVQGEAAVKSEQQQQEDNGANVADKEEEVAVDMDTD